MVADIEAIRERARLRKRAQRARPEGYIKSRECDWKSKLGVDMKFEQFKKWLELQNFICPLCGCEIDESACLDHDHATGKPRGALCYSCNLGLGLLEKHLNAAQAYLQLWRENEQK